jgi:hypothetical protein
VTNGTAFFGQTRTHEGRIDKSAGTAAVLRHNVNVFIVRELDREIRDGRLAFWREVK